MSNNNRAEWLETDETTLQGALQRKVKPMQIWRSIASLQKFSPNQIRTKINNLKRKARELEENPKKRGQQKFVEKLKKYQVVDESAAEPSDDEQSDDEEDAAESDQESSEPSAEEPPLKRRKPTVAVKKEEPKPFKNHFDLTKDGYDFGSIPVALEVPPFLIRTRTAVFILWRFHSKTKLTCKIKADMVAEIRVFCLPPTADEIDGLPLDGTAIQASYLQPTEFSFMISLPHDINLHGDVKVIANAFFKGIMIPVEGQKKDIIVSE